MNNDTTKLEALLHSLKKDASVVPSETFRTNARIRILNTIKPNSAQGTVDSFHRIFAYPWRVAFLVLVLSGITVFGTQMTSPNQPLFPVKVLAEHVALTLAPNQSTKTAIAAAIIAARGDQVQEAKKSGNSEQLHEAIENFHTDVQKIQQIPNVSHETITKTVEQEEEDIRQATASAQPKRKFFRWPSFRQNHHRDEQNSSQASQSATVSISPSPTESTTPSPKTTNNQWNVRGSHTDQFHFHGGDGDND